MSEMVAFYQHQAEMRASSMPMVKELQKKAQFNFSKVGFPTRHHEAWKYTSTDTFERHRFQLNEATASTSNHLSLESLPLKSHVFSFYNGNAINLTATKLLPDGVAVLPLLQALEKFPKIIERYLGNILHSEHAFHDLNTLMLGDGLFIYIPKNTTVTEPLWIHHHQDKENQGVYLRHLIVVDEQSSVTVIEDYTGSLDTCYFTNAVTEISLGIASHLTHYKIQREDKNAFHVGHLSINQAEASQCAVHSVSLGGAWVRSDTTIDFAGENASCLLNGIYQTNDGQHIDHHTEVHHAVPNCQSEQDYKGVLLGKSKAVFNGRVVVAEGAQQTRANQKNKNLLCGRSAEVDTKPQLEIFADDVLCAHGATVGCIDEEALFYLATRGIGREEASHYLKKAFLVDNLKLVDNAEMAAWIEQLLG